MSATILGFPPTRHAAVDNLARKWRAMADDELSQHIRKNMAQLIRKRTVLGVPVALAKSQAVEFERR